MGRCYRPFACLLYNRDEEDVAGHVDANSIPGAHAGSGLLSVTIASSTHAPCSSRGTDPHRLKDCWTWLCILFLGLSLSLPRVSEAHPAAKRLHDDLLSDYNRLIRPVGNHSHKVTVHLGLKLSQLIDICIGSRFYKNRCKNRNQRTVIKPWGSISEVVFPINGN
ncbi:neur_chan_LBD domain-containing protein [Caerostris darwini]|uniref:Neur_chan_LBD domain-containing protein n=1 Tax=Caerostris darwini TaxID=1538125 RepID=A0AAV4PU80_9ARAC|nr:neur_chan_LBD domain-containing protein [Caerostris darwini]